MHTSNLSLHFLDTASATTLGHHLPNKKMQCRHRVAMMQFFLHYSDDGMKFKLPKWKLDSLHTENSILCSIPALRPKLTVKIYKSITFLGIAKGSIDLQQNATHGPLSITRKLLTHVEKWHTKGEDTLRFVKCWGLLDFIKNQSKFVYFCIVLF